MSKKNFIELINVNKTYGAGFVAVENLNIKINRGEFITLLGPSGCGKTTTLRMIAGFEEPTAGKILVDHIDIKKLPIHERPTATVFQDYALFPNMTVFQNITYGLKVMRKPIENTPKSLYKKANKVFLDATKKSHSEIKKILKQQTKIIKEIDKVKKEYFKKPEIEKIQSMRYAQYLQKYTKILEKIQKTCGLEAANLQDHIIRSKFLKYRFLNFFGINYPITFNNKNLKDVQISLNELVRWYLYKQPIDSKIDKLKARYNQLDQESSYWQNYPNISKERFSKKYITRKLTKQEINQKAKAIIKLVGLNENENKYPEELSGGMQQRVALARALVIEPQIILLDEPLSALDAKVRQQMQEELKRLHSELGLTFILVTHDQEEAISLSDKIVVMSKGKIEQFDTPQNIYDHPINQWVASFIGKANIFDAVYLGDQQIKFQNLIFKTKNTINKKIKPNMPIKFMIRPEDFDIDTPHEKISKAIVTSVIYKGLMYDIRCQWNGIEFKIESTKPLEINQVINLGWDDEDIHVMYDSKILNYGKQK